ncbi:DUF618-domain-containing protein [Aaosphaeria arxii CBS 175.79]|uniref:DUF618-domain-containing protein n=1 Tax=Aaosphaeria arxii CBS 175.79 TaxID=1450172 RepID=A0A6A5Y2L8_9PLEO|nr:DUF618-domain-containing protein [Aaosphaeria arxii CBS 175.79]KAF2019782.1 DUF618-domain-containing protein [Aaosphaeria arxii CBS 175.79]
MAFTDEAIKAKLASLNETQESISGVSQWIMFHRRHAERTAQIWMQRVKESTPNKKLSLIYLANEIVQQSKIRKKDEFLRAYDAIIVEAAAAAYKGSSSEVQGKIRRVVEVWRGRQVFKQQIQEQIEAALDEVDRSRPSRKPALGGSLYSSSSVPPELTTVAKEATNLQKADGVAKPAVKIASQEYEKLTNPNNPIPSAAVHAARLADLVKKLATAEGAVAESIKARRELITGLEKLLHTNQEKLSAEEKQVTELKSQKDAIQLRTREVEEAIIKGLPPAEQNAISTAPLPVGSSRPSAPGRPDIEELTPPPMETFTPVGSPQREAQLNPVPDDAFPEAISHPVEPNAVVPPYGSSTSGQMQTAIGALPGADLLSSLTAHTRPVEDGTNGGSPVYGGSTFKKRKTSQSAMDDEYAAFAGDGDLDGIDANVGNLI